MSQSKVNVKSPRPVLVFSFILVALLVGCGETTVSWPSNPDHDWIKEASGRGMANVWGVIFDVDKFEGDLSINPGGELGTGPDDTNATNDLFFGNLNIRLETTGKRHFKLFVNGKRYGNVERGSRVNIDEDKAVKVDDEYRDETS